MGKPNNLRDRFRQRGFTLMELMVVVVIIGVLAAIAVPSIQRFIAKSRESEAPINLAAIARGAQEYYNQEQTSTATGLVLPSQFPRSGVTGGLTSFKRTPTTVPCTNGNPKYARDSSRWKNSTDPWIDLKFSIATSHYFQYGFANNDSTGVNARFVAQASADLDCDKVLSTFNLPGSINTATGEFIRGGIFVTNEGE